LQDEGDDQFIFDVLIEQLGENLDEAHKSRGASKPRHRPKVERGREVGHVRIFLDYFVMWLVYNDKIFKHHF
jgi:hypothetical protein